MWMNMPMVNRVLLGASAVAAVVVGIGLFFWAGSTEYTVLVKDPTQADLQGIVNHLKEKKVDFRLSQDQKSIEVPASKQAELQMSLASAGLLNSGSLGYGLLDKASLGATEKMEDQTIKRALEGHIEQAIASLDPVDRASVTFAPGDDSPFVSEKRSPTASVVIRTKPGMDLDKGSTKAIANLVARSYPGLDPKNITVVDGNGEMLWDGSETEAAVPAVEERMQQERGYKEALSRDLRNHLERAVGPGKYSLVVRCTLNLDNATEKTSDVLPGTRTNRTTEEESLRGNGAIGGGKTPAGVASNAGGATNPPTYQGANVDTSNGNYQHTTSNETMVPGTKETNIVRAPGRVQSLSVAVLLDSSISQITADAIRRELEAIVPGDPTDPSLDRRISVERVAFDTAAADDQKRREDAMAASDRWNRILGYAVPLGVMLLMLFILARSLRRPQPREIVVSPEQMALAGAGAGGGQIDAGSGIDMIVGANDDAAKPKPGENLVKREDSEEEPAELIQESFDANLESVIHLAQSKPESVAMLLRSWLIDEK